MIKHKSVTQIVKDLERAQLNSYNLDNAVVLGEDVVNAIYNAYEFALSQVDGRFPKFIV